LHHLDNLDSKMECLRGLIEQDRQIDGFWTSHNNSLDRPVLKKAKYLEGAPTPDDAPTRASAAPAKSAPRTVEQLQLSINSRRNH